MSQTIVPAPGSSRGALPPSRIAEVGQVLRASFAGSPGRLRLISLGTVLCVVLSALLGGWALQLRSSALERAAAASAHLLLLQETQTQLAEAEAAATNSFLGFGLEPRAQRADYLTAIQEASNDLALAARYSQADAKALGEANALLTRYTGYIGSARANNRAGHPVGASYLEAASTLLRASDQDATDEPRIIPLLQERADADTAAIRNAFSQAANARWLLLLAAVVGIGALLYAQLLVTRHSHRYVNLPAAVSTVLLVVVLAGAAAVMTTAQSEASDVREGVLEQATGLSNSRVAAFEAKAQESLTLINRGSATEADTAWSADYEKALDSLDERVHAGAVASLEKYAAAHRTINQTDASGDWDQAVDQATSTADGSVNELFESYADSTRTDLQAHERSALDRLDRANDQLIPVALALLVTGAICAAGIWWGISLRLDEYR